MQHFQLLGCQFHPKDICVVGIPHGGKGIKPDVRQLLCPFDVRLCLRISAERRPAQVQHRRCDQVPVIPRVGRRQYAPILLAVHAHLSVVFKECPERRIRLFRLCRKRIVLCFDKAQVFQRLDIRQIVTPFEAGKRDRRRLCVFLPEIT